MYREKEINSFIGIALKMAGNATKDNEDPYAESLAYVAAMNWLTCRAGLRVLTTTEKQQAEVLYGEM